MKASKTPIILGILSGIALFLLFHFGDAIEINEEFDLSDYSYIQLILKPII